MPESYSGKLQIWVGDHSATAELICFTLPCRLSGSWLKLNLFHTSRRDAYVETTSSASSESDSLQGAKVPKTKQSDAAITQYVLCRHEERAVSFLTSALINNSSICHTACCLPLYAHKVVLDGNYCPMTHAIIPIRAYYAALQVSELAAHLN